MLIFPAVDLYEGKAVRLYQGDYQQMTVYSDDPVSVARSFARQGAKQVHLVDLKGARDGGTPDFDLVCRIKRETGLFCQIGGGVRTMETVERYLSAGIDRVILGTAAVTDPAFTAAAAERYGNRIAAGVDLKDGFAAIRGWTETTALSARDLFRRLRESGIRTLICTDISRDGAMRGTNLELYRDLSREFDLDLVASGGVSSLEDVRRLAALGLYGAIVGKAYYTGALDLRQAIKEAQ